MLRVPVGHLVKASLLGIAGGFAVASVLSLVFADPYMTLGAFMICLPLGLVLGLVRGHRSAREDADAPERGPR